jgi:pSer/pThr/pTyr-binding forkhead associated (FHA) protein
MPLTAKLVVVGGDVKTTEVELRLPSTIGRGKGTTIVLPHPLVSRQHCEIYEADGQLMVRDLGSLNGTFVNNERITDAPLPPGELLTVGTVTFRAVYELAAQSKPGAAVKRKPDPSDGTVQVTKATTFAASPKAIAAKQSEQESDESLEFDFGESMLPVDDLQPATEPGGPQHPTERLDSTRVAPPKADDTKPGQTKPKPAAKSPVTDADDEDGKADSESDDDLNDFLDSLGTK